MMDHNQKARIEEEARKFFDQLQLQGDLEVQDLDEEGIRISLMVPEPQLFIGEKGQTLFDIQHILGMILRKRLQQPLRLSLDINDYRKNKESHLREMAREAADEVALIKRPKEFLPMSPAERRIIHMEVAERSDVASESVGEGSERRVVIKIREQAPEAGSAQD